MKSDNLKALISVVLAAIFGGGISVFAKIGLKQIPPFSFTFYVVDKKKISLKSA